MIETTRAMVLENWVDLGIERNRSKIFEVNMHEFDGSAEGVVNEGLLVVRGIVSSYGAGKSDFKSGEEISAVYANGPAVSQNARFAVGELHRRHVFRLLEREDRQTTSRPLDDSEIEVLIDYVEDPERDDADILPLLALDVKERSKIIMSTIRASGQSVVDAAAISSLSPFQSPGGHGRPHLSSIIPRH